MVFFYTKEYYRGNWKMTSLKDQLHRMNILLKSLYTKTFILLHLPEKAFIYKKIYCKLVTVISYFPIFKKFSLRLIVSFYAWILRILLRKSKFDLIKIPTTDRKALNLKLLLDYFYPKKYPQNLNSIVTCFNDSVRWVPSSCKRFIIFPIQIRIKK